MATKGKSATKSPAGIAEPSRVPPGAPAVAYRPLASLRSLPNNPRRLGKTEFADLCKSLRDNPRFFDARPIILSDRTGELVILAGNMKAEAAKANGLSGAPTILLSGLTEAQEREIIIRDNAHAGEWDFDALANEWSDLPLAEWGVPIPEDWAGAPTPEPTPEPGAQIDRAEELREKWQTARGQLWQVGRHRVMCGDSTNAEDVGLLMDGDKATGILTDPPYGQNQEGVKNDAPEIHAELMQRAVSILPITDGVVVAFQSPRTFHAWTDAMRAAGFTFERMLWLYKAAQCTFPWRGWILTSESIPVCSIGKAEWQDVHPFAHDCYYLSEVSGELAADAGWHGTVKPLSVVQDILSRICAPESVAYDPFLGSGTTMVASEQLNRACYGMEIEPKYCAVILERMAGMGLKPVLVENQTT